MLLAGAFGAWPCHFACEEFQRCYCGEWLRCPCSWVSWPKKVKNQELEFIVLFEPVLLTLRLLVAAGTVVTSPLVWFEKTTGGG